jgi:two-component system, NarL family, invasion response regulator UvrY
VGLSLINPIGGGSGLKIQIALMLIENYSVIEISEKLHLSVKTISTYRYRVLKKLGVTNDIGLIRLATHDGLLDNSSNLEV